MAFLDLLGEALDKIVSPLQTEKLDGVFGEFLDARFHRFATAARDHGAAETTSRTTPVRSRRPSPDGWTITGTGGASTERAGRAARPRTARRRSSPSPAPARSSSRAGATALGASYASRPLRSGRGRSAWRASRDRDPPMRTTTQTNRESRNCEERRS